VRNKNLSDSNFRAEFCLNCGILVIPTGKMPIHLRHYIEVIQASCLYKFSIFVNAQFQLLFRKNIPGKSARAFPLYFRIEFGSIWARADARLFSLSGFAATILYSPRTPRHRAPATAGPIRHAYIISESQCVVATTGMPGRHFNYRNRSATFRIAIRRSHMVERKMWLRYASSSRRPRREARHLHLIFQIVFFHHGQLFSLFP